jgi:lipoprotein-anchoring transpeptidase ErfK/SrfK
MSTRSLFCFALISAIGTTALTGVAFAQSSQESSAPNAVSQAGPVRCLPLTDYSLENSSGGLLGTQLFLSSEIKTESPAKKPMIVVVEKEHHLTRVLQNHNGNLVEVFRAHNTTGKKSTPTPNGRMVIVEKRWDPTWKPPVSIDVHQKVVDSYSKDKHNPLGTAWMGLNQGFIGLHGTNDPAKIGFSASHGCIRHKNEDIKKLYSLVPVGTPVYIVSKYAGTPVATEDIEYLNGGIQSTLIAQENF